MLESAIQSQIIKKLTTAGWMVVKLIQTNMPGIPDLMALRGGKSVFVEVKQPGKKPTDLQALRMDKLRSQGFEAITATSIKDVEHLFPHIIIASGEQINGQSVVFVQSSALH